VVLGEPEAFVSPPLGVLSEVKSVAKGVGCGAALNDWRQVED
jgi:hypothetical protein